MRKLRSLLAKIWRKNGKDDIKKLRNTTIKVIEYSIDAGIASNIPMISITNRCMNETRNTQVRRIRKMREKGVKPSYENLMELFDDKDVLEAYKKIGIEEHILEELVRQAMRKEKV